MQTSTCTGQVPDKEISPLSLPFDNSFSFPSCTVILPSLTTTLSLAMQRRATTLLLFGICAVSVLVLEVVVNQKKDNTEDKSYSRGPREIQNFTKGEGR